MPSTPRLRHYVCFAIFVLTLQFAYVPPAGAQLQPPGAPTISASVAPRKITVTWNVVPDASQYTVWRAVGGGGFGILATINNGSTTSIVDSGLPNNWYYRYYVVASNGAGSGPQSNIVAAQTPPLDAPSLTASPGPMQITLSWNSVPEADRYHLYRAIGAGAFSFLGTYNTPTTTAVNTGLNNNWYYQYYVVAENGGGRSENSNVAAAQTPPLAAPSVSASASPRKITVTWGAVPEASQYHVYKAIGVGAFTFIGTLNSSGTKLEDVGLNNNWYYQYYVVAENAGGRSENSNVAAAQTPPLAAPSVSAYFEGGKVIVSWGAVPEADSYQVFKAVGAGGFSLVDQPVSPTTSIADSNVSPGNWYSYYVIARNGGGPSDPSNIAKVFKDPPPNTPRGCSGDPIDKKEEPSGGSSCGCSGSGSGASAGDPVNLATGRESYAPAPDLNIYNPDGPNVVWNRMYEGHNAMAGYHSPGLSHGWVHPFDIRITSTSVAGTWGALRLVYYNGAEEILTPQLGAGGQPTGAFTAPTGSTYFATGVPGASAGQWESLTLTWRDRMRWSFTQLSPGTYALTRITNGVGRSIDLHWGAGRTLSQVSDATSGTVLLSLSYDERGKLAAASDAYGRQVSYSFSTPSGNDTGSLTSVSQVVPAGTQNAPARWTHTYAADRQLRTITVPSPTGSGTATATLNYGADGKVSSLVDANGNQRVYTYNTGSTLVQVKDAAGNVVRSWTQNFNSSRRDTGITDSGGTSALIEYNDPQNPGLPTRVVDKNNKATVYTYDQYGNVLTVTSPRNLTTVYTYDYAAFLLGRLTSVKEGSKPATTFAYFEPSGLLQSVTSPSPTGSGTVTTSYTYDALGNVLTVTGPGNNAASQLTTTFNYTVDGTYTQPAKVSQPLTVTDGLGHAAHLRYDTQGRVISRMDADGNETNFSYNIVGQTETVTLPPTEQTGTGRGKVVKEYLYPGGPLKTNTILDESNAQFRQVTYGYGPEGESLSETGSTEPVTYTYDALYRLKTLKDGKNNTTTYNYDGAGNLSSIQMPGSQVIQFPLHDSSGRVLRRIDGNGVVTNYSYDDSENLLTDVQYPATPALNVHFSYDSFGRRTSMTDGTGTHTYTYGDLDELRSVTTSYTDVSAQVVSYDYYPNGSRQGMTTPAGIFYYSYDAAGRLISMSNPQGQATNWTYYQNDRLRTQQLANGALTTYSYDALGRLTRLHNEGFSTPPSSEGGEEGLPTGGSLYTLSDFSNFTYDGAGNVLSYAASVPDTPSASGTVTYQYDAKDQLTREQSTRGAGFTRLFEYDASGNPTLFAGTSKTYNANNQQTTTGLTHDGSGNPTTYQGATLSFDPENRLTSYAGQLTAGYRGDGLRAWKQTTEGRVYYVYDGALPIMEVRACAGSLPCASSIQPVNTFGAAGLVSRVVGQTPETGAAATEFYSFDPQGNVSQGLASDGSVSQAKIYTAHGQALSGVSSEFGYGAQWGYQADAETGLQLLKHRYYDPGTGRFLTKDPSGYSGGINLYGYVRNNPVKYIDPSGREGVLVWPLISGGVNGAAAAGGAAAGGAAVVGGLLAYLVLDAIANPRPGSLSNPLPPRADGVSSCTSGHRRRISPFPLPPLTLDREPPRDDEPCYAAYIRETGWCGRTFTDDYLYEKCMDNAWTNYIRCLNNLPPKPLIPAR
ncbi:MAG TPA: RHS repeat-associated core domain-containing protein [Pyrinomonadaceae bacterium]|nr:RHS repeat-associated core domain-containing protein [Pyrinomonadaceae bacterium]